MPLYIKRSIFLFLFINLCLFAYNQVIKGTILDNDTKNAIYSAAVYISGTSVGALSDKNGNFQLNISKYNSLPLTVSAIGYYSVTINDLTGGKPLLIYLNPKVFELNEVVVNAKSNPRKRRENLTIFRNEFLGRSGNVLNCEIINEDDIIFESSSDNNTLRAFASRPILIDNRALGYKITYYLDKFEYEKESKIFSFRGNIFFEEDSTTDKAKLQFFERKRRNAYLGSRMHFFRSLWINDLNENGFTVRNTANEILNYNRIVFKVNNTKYLSYYSDLSISYYSKQPTSFIILLKDKVFFDASGYFDASLIIWEGEMSRQRIADLLPYEYYPK